MYKGDNQATFILLRIQFYMTESNILKLTATHSEEWAFRDHL